MLRFIKGFVLTIWVSFYMFPFSFTFLPVSINTKIIVAAVGAFLFVYDSIRKRSMDISEPTLFSGLLAAIFSVWCLYSITANDSVDTAYASYIVSFLTWIAGAYGVVAVLRMFYDEVDLEILIRYLALVGVFQCVSAVLIDNNAAFSNFVDKFMFQDGDYYKVHNRMYGIGAALDPAGVRFSTILVLIAHQFSTNMNVRENSSYQTSDIVAFAVITIIGSVISRTTIIGASMGIIYIIISLIRMRRGGFVTTSMLQGFMVFLFVMGVIIAASIYFYQRSDTFEGYLRFGFEAFFNYIETGEFRTSSTDTLSEMWVWPTDVRTWVIGRGTFGVFENFSDIGYCNFIFYCGLIGMTLFTLFFLYSHLVLNRKFDSFVFTSLLLVALTMIIWCKVTTDIFFIDALLFCIDGDKSPDTGQQHMRIIERQPDAFIVR